MDPYTKADSNKLEKIQRTAARWTLCSCSCKTSVTATVTVGISGREAQDPKTSFHVQNPEWPSSSTGNFCGPYFIVQTFLWRRWCKSTEVGYCEILYWELQTVLQYQNSERLERAASVRPVFST